MRIAARIQLVALVTSLLFGTQAWASGDDDEGGGGPGTENAGQNFFRDEYSVGVEPSSGGFTTRVEIRVPAFRGLEPKLALQYSSSAGNGFVGVGWRIDGLSKIERISPGGGTPTYDATDTYALDGMELVQCTALGGDYCTRIQSFQRIDYVGGVPNRWEVRSKDGTRSTYSAFLTPTGSPTFRWLLTEVRDTRNNVVTYSYFCPSPELPGECYPNQITYNGSSGPKITFVRQSRTDDITFATGRDLRTMDQRLDRIDIHVGNDEVRRYELTYTQTASSGRSRLTKIEHFAGSNFQNELPDMTFTYNDAAPDDLDRQSEVETNIVGVGAEMLSGDFNGDGRTDLFYIREANPRNLRVVLGQANGTFVEAATTPVGVYPLMNLGHWFGGDVNGDGCTDVMHAPPQGDNDVFVWRSDCDGTFTKTTAIVTGDPDEVNLRKDLGRWFSGDFNGDGKADLAHATTPGNLNRLYIWESQVTSSTSTFFVREINPSLSSVSKGWWFPADMNGDGLTDIAHVYTFLPGVPAIHVYRSLGNFTFDHQIFSAPPGYPATLQEGTWHIGDFNGDGYSDFFHRTGQAGELLLLFSKGGNGFEWMQIDSSPYSGPHTSTLGGWWFPIELNGDGRTDLYHVIPDNFGGGALGLWHSTGNPGQFNVILQENNPAPPSEPNLWGGLWQGGDFNGDGRDDLVHLYTNQNTLWKWFGQGDIGNKLQTFTNRTGGVTSVTYQPSTGWDNAYLPVGMIMHPVASVTTNDGRGTSNSSHTKLYSFTSGKWGIAERCFLGFATSRTILDAQNNYEETEFDQTIETCTNPRKKVSKRNAANQNFSFTEFQYNHVTAAPPFSSLERERTENECNLTSNCRRTRTETFYDATYGNVVRVVEQGDLATSSNGDERTTIRDFFYNLTDYIVSLPARERIFQTATTNGSGAPLEAETRFWYDTNTGYAFSPPIGNLARIQKWDDFAGTNVFRDSVFGYDSYGNVISETSPRGYTTTTSYDTTFHVFPNVICSHLMHCRDQDWDPVKEVLDQEVDTNGALTTYGYDDFGRRRVTNHPDGTQTQFEYVNVGTPTTQRLRVREPDHTGTDGLVRESFVDGFGREWKAFREGGATQLTEYHEGSDRVLSRSHWHIPGTEARNDTTFVYDGAKRLTRVNEPGGAFRLITYSNVSAIPITIENDVLGKERRFWRDGYGRVKQVREFNTVNSVLQDYDTFFEYDTLGNLSKVIDENAKQATFNYDSLSQKREACDFDLGCWFFHYDANGNLDQQLDARGVTTTFAYDELDRVKTRVNPDGTIQWFYDQEDQPPTDTNIDRLTSITFPGGSQQIEWNNMGLQRSVNRCVEGDCRLLQQEYQYGRIHQLTYPDNEQVTFGYDSAGFVSSVSGVASSILWNARGQIEHMTYANLVVSDPQYHTTYDALDIMSVTGTQGTVYQADYGYNAAVEVTSVTSTSHPKLNLGFGYDDLHRVTNVTGSQVQTFQYGPTGNILSNDLVGTYEYLHPTKPHAVTKAGARHYAYDANGNLGSVTTRTPDCVTVERLMQWGADNRLRWVSANAETTSYRYDADGQRVSKSGPGGTTHYFGTLFEVEDPDGAARLVKYYYAGDFLLARQEGATRLWYHQDHLGSVRAMTNSAGVRDVAYEYAVFGDAIQTIGAADNTRGYGAHWRDDESHLVYMGARYHDPVLGRFTQPDPVIPEPGDPQSWNRYSYVRNNPFNRIDPTGNIDLGAELGGYLADRIGVNRAVGEFVGSLANGAVPGAGELADLGVLFSMDHKVGTGERLLAVGSLVGSIASFGTSPNVGSAIGKTDEVAEAISDGITSGTRAVGDAPASSAAQAARLKAQLTGQEIAGGHAFDKHVLEGGEFPEISTREGFASHIESVLENPTHSGELSGGRSYAYDEVSNTLVVRNPSAADGGTAFRPTDGVDYLSELR